MNNEIIFAIIMNGLYIIMWFIFNKIRSSQNSIIRDWDNGNEFYESLNENDKDQYWKEDTHILNIFFMMLFLFLDAALFLHYAKINLWVITLITGIIISCLTGIIMSSRLKRRYKSF